MSRLPMLLATTCLSIALFSCASPQPESGAAVATMARAADTVLAATVERAADGAGQVVSWTLAAPARTVDVYVSSDPAATPAQATLLADDSVEAQVAWKGEGRAYFTLVPDAGRPVQTALRVLPLEGGRNFRDLGGYATADGRTVKWGQLFRSGAMHELTAADYRYLSGLGVRVVCDLRTAQERSTEPTNWAAGDARYLTFADPESGDGAGGLMAVFRDPAVTPDKVANMMAEAYVQIAREQTPAYREMFRSLAAGDTPLTFNCSAGKDRTGVGAALILTALGVPRETVVADYALSDKVVDYMKVFAAAPEPGADEGPYAFLRKLPPELVAPLMRSDPRYIERALASMEASHGSVIGYIKAELGVTDADLDAIRSRLLK